LEVAELVEDLKGRLRALQSMVFPQQVLLELHDTRMIGQPLLNGQPGPLCVDLPLPAQTCKAGLPIETEALSDLIGELMLREKLIDAHVMASLPQEAVQWRVVNWADAPPPEEAVAALRAKDPDLGFPYPLSEATIDLQPLPSAPGKLLLAATSREVVDGWIEVFDQAGLNLDRLASPQSCRLAALRGQLAELPPDLLVLLLSPEGTRGRPFMAIRGGIPLFERILVEQGERLIPEIQRCLTFLRNQFAEVGDLRLLLEGPLEQQTALEASLGQPAQPLELRTYASLVIQGLAIPEQAP
jgi:Tfp pilus assembly PilM family ATPase